VELLLEQARHCEAMGSPLYADLLRRAADDAATGGPTRDLLADDPAPGPRGDALGLRLMAAFHRLALDGQAPALAAALPSTRHGGAGGTAVVDADPHAAWDAVRTLLRDRRDLLRPLVTRPCQTNEVGRAAALVFGFFEAAATGLPLRLLEVGASAGLNLRCDHFRFGGGGAVSGPAGSPVNLEGLWRDAPPHVLPSLTVVERAGCDRRPIDATTAEGRLSLLASVWADQQERFARLRGAIALARRVPATVEQADVADWLPPRLREPRPGCATVVYHSIFDEYLSKGTRRAFHEALRDAGARAHRDAPLFWVRLEPVRGTLGYAVTFTRWPGGHERVVARSFAHGSEVRLS
jgi:hypothetical protein